MIKIIICGSVSLALYVFMFGPTTVLWTIGGLILTGVIILAVLLSKMWNWLFYY